MSTVMSFPEKTYRLTVSESELADLRYLGTVAILNTEREIKEDQKLIAQFKLAVDLGVPREFDLNMFTAWTGHLAHDEKSLERLKRAQKALERAQSAESLRRRRR